MRDRQTDGVLRIWQRKGNSAMCMHIYLVYVCVHEWLLLYVLGWVCEVWVLSVDQQANNSASTRVCLLSLAHLHTSVYLSLWLSVCLSVSIVCMYVCK